MVPYYSSQQTILHTKFSFETLTRLTKSDRSFYMLKGNSICIELVLLS
jgi:hypothetical protein